LIKVRLAHCEGGRKCPTKRSLEKYLEGKQIILLQNRQDIVVNSENEVEIKNVTTLTEIPIDGAD